MADLVTVAVRLLATGAAAVINVEDFDPAVHVRLGALADPGAEVQVAPVDRPGGHLLPGPPARTATRREAPPRAKAAKGPRG